MVELLDYKPINVMKGVLVRLLDDKYTMGNGKVFY